MTIDIYLKQKIKLNLLVNILNSKRVLTFLSKQSAEFVGTYLLYCYFNTLLPHSVLPVTRDNQQLVTDFLAELFYQECDILAKNRN